MHTDGDSSINNIFIIVVVGIVVVEVVTHLWSHRPFFPHSIAENFLNSLQYYATLLQATKSIYHY